MIDTVKFRLPVLVCTSPTDFNPELWRSEFRELNELDRDGKPKTIRKWLLTHRLSGLRGWGTETTLQYFEVSLPRILFGHNGCLLTTQDKIDEAMDKVFQVLDQIGDFDHLPEFRKVDLVWQFEFDPNLFLAAHNHARHRRIKRDVVKYEGGSLMWRGSNLSVCMYDKTLEMLKQPGKIVRVEARLQTRALKKYLGPDRQAGLDFHECYNAYRNILLGFCPSSVPKFSGLAEYLAIGNRQKWAANGLSAFEIYALELGDRQKRRLQKQISQARKHVFQFDWPHLLPPDGPPKAVEITDDLINKLRPKRKLLL
jgi:hypothetical protein